MKGAFQHDSPGALQPEKILVQGSGEEVARFLVRNSDLDMNNHVNNTKYAQWILDSLPVDTLRSGVNLHGYEVNFLAEARLGDEIIIRRFAPVSGEGALEAVCFQGARVADGKSIFTARLLATAK
jgi:acyl-ACP thioesterase